MRGSFRASKTDRNSSKYFSRTLIKFEVIMRFRKSLCALILALFSLQTFQFTALADEGMWPFNNVDRKSVKRKYGFDITDEWLHKVQMAAVRFNNGGSGSFVSPTGGRKSTRLNSSHE